MSNPPKQLPLSQTANNANGNASQSQLPPPTPLRSNSQGFSTPPSQTLSRPAPPPPPLFAVPRAPASRSVTPAPAQTPAPRSSAAFVTPFVPPSKPAQRPATMPVTHSSFAAASASTRPVAPAAYGAPTSASAAASAPDRDQFTTPAPVSTVTRPHWSTAGIISKSDRVAPRSKPPPTPARPMNTFKSMSTAPTPVGRSRAFTHGAGSVPRLPLSESRMANGFGGSGFQAGVGATPARFQAPRAPPSTGVRGSAAGRNASTSSLFASPATLPVLPNMLTREYFVRAAARSNSNSNSHSHSSTHQSAESFENALPYDEPPPDSLSPTSTVSMYLNDHFRINDKLGQGSFSTVYHVTRLADSRSFALKSLRNHYRGALDRRCCLEEVWIWHVIAPHPRLVHLAAAWEQMGTLHMCMEVCPRGTLADYLETRAKDVGRPSSEAEVWGYLADIGQALQWVHARGVAHLDVKPDNVYLTQGGGCKLGDFGLATYVGYDAGNPRPSDEEMRALVTEAGGVWDERVHGLASVDALKFTTRRSPDDRHGDGMYAPTESVDGVFSTKTDVFAYGLMALEMVTDAKMPSEGDGFDQLRSGSFTAFLPMIPTETSRELRGIMSACLHAMPAFRPTIKQIMDVEQMKVAKQRRWADVWSKEEAPVAGAEDVDMESDMSLTPTPANPHPDRNPPSWNGAATAGLLGPGAQVTTPTMTPASLLHTPRKPAVASTPLSFASPTPISSSAFGNSPGNPFAAPSAPPPQTPSRAPGAATTHRVPKRALSRSSSMSSSGSTPGARPTAHLKPHFLSYDPSALATATFGAGKQDQQRQPPRNPVGGCAARAEFAGSSQPPPSSTPGPFASSSQPLPESTPMAAGDGYMWPRMPHHKKPHLLHQPLSKSSSFSEGFSDSSPQTYSSPPDFNPNPNSNGVPPPISTLSLTPSSTSSSPVTDYDSPLAARMSTKPRSSMQPPGRPSFHRPNATPSGAAAGPPTPHGFSSVLFTPTPSSASQPSYIPGPEPQDSPMADADMSDDDDDDDDDELADKTFIDEDGDHSSQGGVNSYGGDDDEYDDDDTPVHMQSPLRGVRSRTMSHPVTFRPVHFAGFGGVHSRELDPRGASQVSQGPSPPLTAPEDGHVRDDEDSVMEDAPGSDPGTHEYERQAAAAADQRRRASVSAFGSPRR